MVGIFLRRGNSGHKRSSESETDRAKQEAFHLPTKETQGLLPQPEKLGLSPRTDRRDRTLLVTLTVDSSLENYRDFSVIFSYLLCGNFVPGPQDPHSTA